MVINKADGCLKTKVRKYYGYIISQQCFLHRWILLQRQHEWKETYNNFLMVFLCYFIFFAVNKVVMRLQGKQPRC